jgi:hypothetical protein
LKVLENEPVAVIFCPPQIMHELWQDPNLAGALLRSYRPAAWGHVQTLFKHSLFKVCFRGGDMNLYFELWLCREFFVISLRRMLEPCLIREYGLCFLSFPESCFQSSSGLMKSGETSTADTRYWPCSVLEQKERELNKQQKTSLLAIGHFKIYESA